MRLVKTLARAAGLGLCALVFAGSAFADPGNGNGNGGTPPGQEKKAEQPAPVQAATPAPAPQAAAAPGQAKKADKAAAKAATPAPKPAKAEQKAAPKADGSKGRSAEAHHHVVICHRTGSESNPYVVINIPWTAWSEAHSPATGAHPDLNGRHDILLKDPASRPGSKDGFSKEACEAAAPPATVQHTDLCPNIEGMQTTVPAGKVKDAKGNCVHVQQQNDVCPNLAGMQPTTPVGLVKDELGNCVGPVVPASTVIVTAPAAEKKPTSGVRGSLTQAPAAEQKSAAGVRGSAKSAPASAQAAGERPSSGVLGAVASAPEAIADTATSGTLPFTGVPLWIAMVLGGGLLAVGFALRRAAQH